MRRLFLLLVVAIGLGPGTWWRSPGSSSSGPPDLRILPLEVSADRVGAMRVLGAWELRSPSSDFRGYSALVGLGDGTLLAVSDRGRFLRFSAPDEPERSVEIGEFSAAIGDNKRLVDVESLTRDPRTGRLWAGYEHSNLIERRDASGETQRYQPPAMRHWPSNAGPEAMTRLDDGRFIVLSEGSTGWTEGTTPGLIFSGDPIDGAEPARFGFKSPQGFRPVDMAQLSDGRVLVLLRAIEWGLPPGFSSMLVVADPARIAEGATWRGQIMAQISDPSISENYEGLAIESGQGGEAIVWLISDDNQSVFQRTLLLKLGWSPK